MTRRLGMVIGTLTLVAAACGGGGSNEPADAGGGAANGGGASKSEVAIPGAAWTRVEGDPAGGPGAQRLEAVAPLGDGFVAVGVDVATDSVVAWTTPDGDAWKRVEVEAGAGAAPVGGSGLLPRDVAASGDRVVIVGTIGSRCNLPACGRFEMVAWVSPDAGATWQRADVDRAFAKGAATHVSDVAATSEGFVAVGHTDGPSPADWEAVVWTSTDGTTWNLAAEFPPVAWPIVGVQLATTDDVIGVLAEEAVCGDPFANGVFFALGAPFATSSRGWTSIDGGATWTEMPAEQLAPLGVHPFPEAPACDDVAAVDALGDDDTIHLGGVSGAFYALPVSREGSSAVFSSTDFRRWDVGGGEAPFGGPPYEHVEARTLAEVDGVVVALDVRRLQETEYVIRTWRARDASSWEQVGDGADLPGPFRERTDFLKETLPLEVNDIAVNGDTAVIVANQGPVVDELDGALWVSRAR